MSSWMDSEPKPSAKQEIVGFLALAACVPVLFVGLTYLLEKLAEVFA